MSQQSQFLSYIMPLIDSGLAPTPITVAQTLGDAAKSEVLLQHTNEPVYLQVNGPQTSLTEADIAGVYPAPGSTNSPDNYLPHIALKRRTLPWERTGPGGQKPWLLLLLLKSSELQLASASSPAKISAGMAHTSVGSAHTTALSPSEIISPKGKVTRAELPGPVHLASAGPSVVAGTVGDASTRDSLGYNAIRATHLEDSAKVNLLFVQNSLLSSLLPVCFPPEWPLLCNVKRTNNGGDDVDCSIVIGNRLPDASLPTDGSSNSPELHTAFLVSVENRCDLYDPTRAANPTHEAAFIVLHSWSFTPSRGGDFEEVMRSIRIEPNGGVMRFGNLTKAPAPGATGPLTSTFDSLLDKHGLFIQPLDHTQAGKVTYRGPLRPFPTAPRNSGFALRSAPEEFTDAAPNTPLDYSHAVAFELGKMLAVGSHDVLEDLRQVHGVLNVIAPQVAVSQLPVALQKPEWVVDPAWGDKPWSMPLTYDKGQISSVAAIAKNANAFIGTVPGDVSGVSAQVKQFANIANTLQVMNTPAQVQIGQIDIVTVAAGDLEKQFPIASIKVQG